MLGSQYYKPRGGYGFSSTEVGRCYYSFAVLKVHVADYIVIISVAIIQDRISCIWIIFAIISLYNYSV